MVVARADVRTVPAWPGSRDFVRGIVFAGMRGTRDHELTTSEMASTRQE